MKWLMCFLCMLGAVTGMAQGAKIIRAERYKTGRSDCAIFAADVPDIYAGTDRFTPSKADVDKAEQALRTQLASIDHSREPVIHKHLPAYLRQYVGYKNKSGERILLINCLWKDDDYYKNDQWLQRIIHVRDGGSYFWNVQYNLDTGRLSELRINGEA